MRAQSTPPPLKHPLHTVQSGQDAQLNNTLALHRYWYLVHVAPPHTYFVTLARAAFTVQLLPPFFLPLLLLDMYAFLTFTSFIHFFLTSTLPSTLLSTPGPLLDLGDRV